MKPSKNEYSELIENIGSTLLKAKENAVKAINTELVHANWEIGRHIVEFEQHGKEKADYGSSLLANLAKDLKIKFGKGFSKSNIYLCRQFYIKYPKFQTVSGILSWSHYAELLTVSDNLSRSFYEKQSIKENWTFREMKKIKSAFIIIGIMLIAFNLCVAQDTIVIHPITWSTPSPDGFNKAYEFMVDFPTEGEWRKIIMVHHLKCDELTKQDKYPCGEWDYSTHTALMEPVGDTVELFELGGFVTPYGKYLKLGGEKGWKFEYDITDYAPLLKGKKKIFAGNNQEVLDLKFYFIKGIPPRKVLSVKNMYPFGEYNYGQLADDSVLKPLKLILPKDATGYKLKARISGHGHYGPKNCCEWDSKTHTYSWQGWGTSFFRWNVWKDCGNNPIYPQGGTWPFDRAGWCPGTKVDEYDFELTPYVKSGDTLDFDYSIEHYANNGEKGGSFRMSHQFFSFSQPNFQTDAEICEIMSPSVKDNFSRINPVCHSPIIVIRNTGKQDLHSIKIKYGVLGEKQEQFIWNGHLSFLQKDTLRIPFHFSSNQDGKQFIATIEAINNSKDEYIENNVLTSLIKLPENLPGNITIKIKTNNLGRSAENSLYIIDDNETTLFYKGDFTDDKEFSNTLKLKPGCYEMLFKDNNEDGIGLHWWNTQENPKMVGSTGKIWIEDEKGNFIKEFNASFGQELLFHFQVIR